MRHYLLTGSTGVVGSAILEYLYQQGEKVTFLLRAKSENHFQDRVKNLLAFCKVDVANNKSLFPLRATLSSPNFGLQESQYRKLTQSCTHIIHCAAKVNFLQPLEKALADTEVISRNVLQFMEDMAVPGKMEHVSTVGVAGKAKGPLLEEWVPEGREFRNSYEAAKAHAEKLVKEKIEAGWDITVHRPSMVIGNSKTGAIISFQIFYYLSELLTGAHTFGILPDLKGHYLDTIPSDYFAAVVYWSSLQNNLSTTILHSCCGENGGVYLNDLGDMVLQLVKGFRDQGINVTRIPMWVFRFLMVLIKRLSPSHLKKSMNNLPVFMAYLDSGQSFSNKVTQSILENSEIAFPSPQSYLPPILEYYFKSTHSFAKGKH